MIEDRGAADRPAAGPGLLVVTGAGSPLGARAVRALLAGTADRVLALGSPRTPSPAAADRLEPWSADLTLAPPADLAARLAAARRVFHFAWTRSAAAEESARRNRAMVDHLLDAMPDPARFWFISSVSASPRPLSAYGMAKHQISQHVRARGGSVLVCGLVVEPDPARGPYRMLRRLVAGLPLAIRAGRAEPPVFPLRIEDLGAAVTRVAAADLPAGSYRMFGAPVGLNDFLAWIELGRPRARIPLRFDAGWALAAARGAKRARLLPAPLCDQVLTFLYKDAPYLLAHAEIPGLAFRRCEGPEFFR